MRFTLASGAAILLLGSTANASASAPEAAHLLYPRGSLARDLLDKNWGVGHFGGAVSAIPIEEAGIEIDEIVTVTTTVTVTKSRGTKTKRDAVPTAIMKRGLGEGAHGHGHNHGHLHHHHHHQHKANHKTTEEKASTELDAEHLEKSELSPAEEAKFLNDAFSLEMFKVGGACSLKFTQAVCIDNKISVCGTSEAKWETVVDCTAARRRCGAAAKDDGVLVSCMNITEVEYPEKRPSEKLHNDLRK